MIKVYKALYKTPWVYSDGYLVVFPDNVVKGVFAFDYMYIYKDDEKYTLFLKDKSYSTFQGLLKCVMRFYEFYSFDDLLFDHFENYLFYSPCSKEDGSPGITELSLQLLEQILDEEEIKIVLLSIRQAEA